MEHKFCASCGSSLKENYQFCGKCGTRVFVNRHTIRPYNTKIPGRGFGISSMVLGIIGTFYSIYLLFGTISAINTLEALSFDTDVSAIVPAILLFAILPLLALIFGATAIKRKYKCGISISGLVLGAVGLTASAVSLIIIAANI